MRKTLNIVRNILVYGKKAFFSNSVKNFGRLKLIKNLRLEQRVQSSLTKKPWLEFSNYQTRLSNLQRNKFARGFSYAFGFGLLCNNANDFNGQRLTDLVNTEFFLKETVDNFLNYSLENEKEHIANSLNSNECESINSTETEDSDEYCEKQETSFKDIYIPDETNSLTSNENQSENENSWSLLDDIINDLGEEAKTMLTNVSDGFEVVSSASSERQQITNDKFDEITHSQISNFRKVHSFDLNQEISIESDIVQFTPIGDEFWAHLYYFLENNPDFILKDEVFLEKLQSYFDI